MDLEKFKEILILVFSVSEKHSPFYFNKFPRFGIIISPEKYIENLAEGGYLTHKGYSESFKGVIENVLITEKGKAYLLSVIDNDFWDFLNKNGTAFALDFLPKFIPKVLEKCIFEN